MVLQLDITSLCSPLEGFTENDADISIQTWSNQGPGGQNMTDGEIRFVVAKTIMVERTGLFHHRLPIQ